MQVNKLIIAYLLFYSILGYGQKYDDKYNLDFEAPLISHKSTWIFIPDDFRIEVDTTEKTHGGNSFLLSRSYLKREFTACLYQTILLPNPAKNIEVSVLAKSILLQYAWLKVIGFDRNRNFLRSDSISILMDNNWNRFLLSLDSEKEIRIINIEIWAKEPFTEKKKRVKLWLDDMNILIDGKNIYSYDDNNFRFSESEINGINNYIKLSPELKIPINEIYKIGERKIFGYGETTHGNKEIEISIFNNIKQLISENNCRLVLLEIPIDIGIRLNQFVQEGIIDEDIKEIVSGITSNIEDLCSFIEWIKNYNITSKEKVTIFGIDTYSDDSPRHISNFIINKTLSSGIVDSLLFLINSHNYRSIPLKLAQKNADELGTILGKTNYELIVQYLKNRTDSMCTMVVPFKKSPDWDDAYRDYILWQNTKFAIETFSDKNSSVAIQAHLSHLNKNCPIFLTSVKSLGQYISEYYGKDYYLTGMLFGEGTISVRSILTKKASVQKIDPPIHRSIEYLCFLSKGDCFYKTLPIATSEPVMIRKIGAFYLQNHQFVPSFFNGSMDAIIFIRKSNNSMISQNNKPKDYKLHDLYQDRIK